MKSFKCKCIDSNRWSYLCYLAMTFLVVVGQTYSETEIEIKTEVATGMFYDQLLLPNGKTILRAVSGFDGKTFTLRGVDPIGKPMEFHTSNPADLPASVAMETNFAFLEGDLYERLLVARNTTPLRTWNESLGKWIERPQRTWRMLTPGPVLFFVPEGYTVFGINVFNGADFCGAELPTPRDGKTFVAIERDAFVSLSSNLKWNRTIGARNIIRPKDPKLIKIQATPGLVLFNLANPSKAILKNSTNVMKSVWIDKNPLNQNLALVKTDVGWMSGILKLLPVADATTIDGQPTSTDLPAENYSLHKVSERAIKPGLRAAEFRDEKKSMNHLVGADLLKRCYLTASDIEQIRTFGLALVFSRMLAPEEVIFPKVEIPQFSNSPDSILITNRETCQISVSEMTPTTIGLRIREIFTTRDHVLKFSSVVASLEKETPRSITKEETVYLPLDSDGTFKFTDGEKIFEVTRDASEFRISEYAVTKEAQKK